MPTRRKKKNRTARALKRMVVVLVIILAGALGLLIFLSREETPPQPTQSPTQGTQEQVTDPPTNPPTDPPTDPPTEPPYTGWQELDGSTYYLVENIPCTGLAQVDGMAYCFDENGVLQKNTWCDIGYHRYYADENGNPRTGWLTLDGWLYYLKDDGAMARGQLEIQGEVWFFDADGRQLYLVNPWHYLPKDYDVSVKDIPSQYANSKQISAACYDDLMRMLKDCEDAMAAIYGEGVHDPFVRSAYRSLADQRYLYNNKLDRVKAAHPEYSQAEAEAVAAKSVAIPGTSEHQLGLAVDIVDSKMRDLTKEQEETPVQQWLMEHCWEYGFILRYPNGTTDVTGIIYEPWHYRYVGVALSQQLRTLGVTLEEYIAGLTE